MNTMKKYFLILIGLVLAHSGFAHINPEIYERPSRGASGSETSFRDNCDNAVAQMDMAVNNVRARLTTGGDIWWDGDAGRYVVPKVSAGSPEVSSLFAGAVWLGGVDDGGSLKVACQTYGRSTGDFDFWPGPLVPDGPDQGTVDKETCADWDRFFVVNASSIKAHRLNFEQAVAAGVDLDPNTIPTDLKGWPGRGNPYFFDIHGFELPNTTQGLAGFYDNDCDMLYDPAKGDFPMIEIRDCEPNNCDPTQPQRPAQFGDQMIFWIYNDAGNSHAESNSPLKMNMEVQVQAFAYSTNDEINNMTFYRYKLVNRAVESIDSTYFGMWADPDLGCHTDDYVGCDIERSLGFVYNQDALDGTTGCQCDGGVNTYCDEVPILGLDYFRGPQGPKLIEIDANGDTTLVNPGIGEPYDTIVELGMSSFTYYNNGSVGSPASGTTDPNNEVEYYNYLTGSWRDGSPITFGGTGYQTGGEEIDYVFPNPPNLQGGWSMCEEGLGFGDRRTIQATGPFRLDPGAVNELIVGAVWVPDQSYPCPDISKLQEADDVAQALFDNCFQLTDCPDAPDVDFIEMDREVIMVLTNGKTSNNADEDYAAVGLKIPDGVEDNLYKFEGYRIYQLADADTDLSAENRSDPSKVREIFEVDIKNGIGKLFNWKALSADDRPISEEFFVPEMQVDGNDEGISHTFRVTEDQFASGDRRLINHKQYYFIAVAYAHNDYEPFDPDTQTGQKETYCEGRNNIGPLGDGKPYTVIPRPIVDRTLQAAYGDGAVITRIDGVGTATNFLDISDESRKAIEQSFSDASAFDGTITYAEGRGPIDIEVYNPLEVVDGEFELTFFDANTGDDVLEDETYWQLTNLSAPGTPIISDTSIAALNQQIIKEYGFSVAIGQVEDAGTEPQIDASNGYIGYEEEYTNGEAAVKWLGGIQDDYKPGGNSIDQVVFNYVPTSSGQVFEAKDPNEVYNDNVFVPYHLCNWEDNTESVLPWYVTPAWTNSSGNSIVNNQTSLSELNNVDIVFTSNPELWSRCVVVETANKWYIQEGIPTEASTNQMDIRQAASVTKYDNDGDGLADIDTDESRLGFGWFPGYAIDVETGKRLNIFFGENSAYDGTIFGEFFADTPRGRDMMFNPSSQVKLNLNVTTPTIYEYYAGGQHMVYVTDSEYDGCEAMYNRLKPSPSVLTKVNPVKTITWTGLILPTSGAAMSSYAEGLIPEDVRVKLRVNNPYKVEVGTGDFNGYPTYRFKLEGKQAAALDETTVNEALDMINVVPNPYYGFSDYETSQFTKTVKITNLPAECTVTIYSLDGKFIRQYDRNETGALPKGSAIDAQQILPALEWDLNNSKNIPVASGVYLIHVKAPGYGERVLKWFGVNRQFDASGL